MPPAGRLGDKAQGQADAHGCPACPHPTVGPAIIGSPDVNINGRPALRKDDTGVHAVCCGPNMWTATLGAATVFINGKAAHRQNDLGRSCGGTVKLIEGSQDVIIGDLGGGGAGGAGGAGAGQTGSNDPGRTAVASGSSQAFAPPPPRTVGP